MKLLTTSTAVPILYRNAVLCLALRQCRNRFLSAFLLGNVQTYATRGVPYYRVSRIFMSRIFSVPVVTSEALGPAAACPLCI